MRGSYNLIARNSSDLCEKISGLSNCVSQFNYFKISCWLLQCFLSGLFARSLHLLFRFSGGLISSQCLLSFIFQSLPHVWNLSFGVGLWIMVCFSRAAIVDKSRVFALFLSRCNSKICISLFLILIWMIFFVLVIDRGKGRIYYYWVHNS